jgi:hypothetical protein
VQCSREATTKQHPNSELRRRVLLIETRVSGRKANREIILAVTATVHEHHNKTWQDFRSGENKEENQKGHKQDPNKSFSLKFNKVILNLRRSPPSLPHLIIGIKDEFLTHFYSRNYENEIRK